jgi:hypothetical protein
VIVWEYFALPQMTNVGTFLKGPALFPTPLTGVVVGKRIVALSPVGAACVALNSV